MVYLGFEPGAAGLQAKMKPQSYGGNPRRKKEFLIQYEKAENPFAVFE